MKELDFFFFFSLSFTRNLLFFIPARFPVVRQDFDSQPGFFFFPFCVSFLSFLVPGCMFQFFRFCLSSDIIEI